MLNSRLKSELGSNWPFAVVGGISLGEVISLHIPAAEKTLILLANQYSPEFPWISMLIGAALGATGMTMAMNTSHEMKSKQERLAKTSQKKKTRSK